MHFSTLATSLALGTTGWAAYTLQDDYFAGGNFFDEFSFWDTADPTEGFVNYGNHTELYQSTGDNAKMYVSDDASAPDGRKSIRITSNKSYDSGLIILDIDSMPGGVCGLWPAFWTVGPDWPSQGEIDIIEGVNQDTTNQMTLHTGPDCSISSGNSKRAEAAGVTMSGTVLSTDCDVSNGKNGNQGCGISTDDKQGYGTGLNENGGGVYATEWTGSSISVFFFARSSIPSDITDGKPDPSGWGNPVAYFSGGCDFSKSFTHQQIVFDTTFCGSWAGADDVWGQSCAASTGTTCQDWVANHGSEFTGQHWSVNALRVYQNDGASSPEPSSPAPGPAASWPAQGSAVSAPLPTGSATQSAPGFTPIVSGSSVLSAPGGGATTPPAVPAPSSPAETQSWQQPSSQTWDGGNPWQSGRPWVQTQEDDDGSWSVGTPAEKRRHARHLLQHTRHLHR